MAASNSYYDEAAKEFGVEQQRLDINGQSINFVRSGTGSVNVLCMSGTLGDWTDFAPLFGKFDSSKYTVVALDFPGYGRSIPPERKYTMGTNMLDAKVGHELMKQLNLLPFSILGWSEGMRAACLCACNFKKDVVCVTSWGGAGYIMDFHVKYFQKMGDINVWPESEGKSKLIQKYGKEYFAKTWAAQSDFYINVFSAVPNGNLIFDSMQRIQCPFLLLLPMKDAMGGEHIKPQYQQIIKKVKNSRLIEKADGRHDVHLQYPEWFMETVEPFIEDSLKAMA